MSSQMDKDLANEALIELYKSAIEFHNKANALEDESFRNKLVDIFETIADEISCALVEVECGESKSYIAPGKTVCSDKQLSDLIKRSVERSKRAQLNITPVPDQKPNASFS